MNRPPHGNEFRKMNAHFEMFKGRAQHDPNMTVFINEGTTWVNGVLVEFVGGNTPEITPTVSGAKWVLVTLNNIGGMIITDGSESANPTTLPALPSNNLPMLAIYLKAGDTKITNDMIFDIRPILDAHYLESHNLIPNREEANSHPITSITGLVDALNKKPDINQMVLELNNKASLDGTTAQAFTFNTDQTGAPSSDILLSVNRGASTNVGIKWNETLDLWQYTNNGADWFAIGFEGTIPVTTELINGVGKLTVAAVNPAEPLLVGDNDPRMLAIANKANTIHNHLESDITDLDKYTKTEVDTALTGKAPLTHTHADKADTVHAHLEADITDLDKYTQAQIDTALSAKSNTVHSHLEADITDLDKYTQAQVDTALAGKAATAHGHIDKADVVHTHLEADITDLDKYTKTEVDSAVNVKANIVGVDDIEITDTLKGVILKSENGTRYRIKVDNSGTLSTEVVS